MMKRRNIIMVMMMSLLLGSCSSEDILSVPNGNGRIRFDVGVSQSEEVMETPINTSPLTCGNDTLYAHSAALRSIELHNDVTSKTRGTEVNGSSFYDIFGLYGYVYDKDQTWSGFGSTLAPTISNEKITNGSPWTSSAYLPGNTKKMAFFAYAPYTTDGIDVTDGTGAPKLTYTINSNVSEQKDLLVAKSVDVEGNASSVALDFKHALTAVKFSVGTITGFTKINKIVISGVKNKGTLSLYGDNWSLSESTASYTIEKEIDLSTVNGGDITGSSTNDLLLLMPQTFSDDNAKLEITMTNDIGNATFSTPLKGEWKKGYTVTYLLSVDRVAGEFHFEVTPSTTSIPMEGGDIELKVKSYYQITGGAQVPIPWSGTYNIGSNQYTLSGDGSVNDDIRKISLPANNSTLTHTQTLAQNQSKGTADNPWNLSNSQGKAEVENTANCYVVNSQGTYSIPLVYGCAIKDGQANTIAYGKGTYKGNTYNSSTFKTHNDQQISSPYLKDNGITVDGAELLWQEVQGMITEVNVQDEKIVFTIGDNIAQGNALIAAKENGTIVWSWHIWVTDRNISETVPIKCNDETSIIYNFMQVPLGWCDPSPGASPIEITVSLTQDNSAKHATAVVNQAGAAATSGNAPYYQWGRKDPLCASVGTASTTTLKTLYDISNSTVSYSAIDCGTVGNSIKNPGAFINANGYYDWNSPTCYDTWNAVRGNTSPTASDRYTHDEIVKSVYDPCPYGFKMPETKAFTGFTSNGANKTSSNYNNGSWDTNGWKFYTNGYRAGDTDFWIAGGYRSWIGGSLSYVGSYGVYWSAGPYSNTFGCCLDFDSSGVSPQNDYVRAYGFSVRPVSE